MAATDSPWTGGQIPVIEVSGANWTPDRELSALGFVVLSLVVLTLLH